MLVSTFNEDLVLMKEFSTLMSFSMLKWLAFWQMMQYTLASASPYCSQGHLLYKEGKKHVFLLYEKFLGWFSFNLFLERKASGSKFVLWFFKSCNISDGEKFPCAIFPSSFPEFVCLYCNVSIIGITKSETYMKLTGYI